MPEPLLMPVMVTAWPSISKRRDVALATMSVVMMASAAANQLFSFKLASAVGKPEINLSTGKGSKITPVEKGKICSAFKPSKPAKAAQLCWAACMPCSPVPAFAQPVLTNKARMPCLAAKCDLHSVTGAAQN